MSQRPHLRSLAQLLQALDDLPVLFLAVDEDVALALLVAEAGAQNVEALVFTGLGVKREREKDVSIYVEGS